LESGIRAGEVWKEHEITFIPAYGVPADRAVGTPFLFEKPL